MTQSSYANSESLAQSLPQSQVEGGAASSDQADPYVLQGSASTSVEKITLKQGDAFLVADARGDLPESEQETGLYWRGTRFLRTCDVFLTGQPLIPLSHSISDEEGSCQIDLTNPFLRIGTEVVYQGNIHVRRRLELHGHVLTERLFLTSYHPEAIAVKLGLKLGADFRDIFEVRGMARMDRGELFPPKVTREAVTLRYVGRDDVTRESHLTFSPQPSIAVMQGLFWDLALKPCEPIEVRIVVSLSTEGDSPTDFEAGTSSAGPHDTLPRGSSLPTLASDNVFFNRLLRRGMHDLEMMCTLTAQGLYPYGGIPWYVAPFGRDALITSVEFLPWFPQVARGTLAFLAAYQGKKVDEFTEEEPGRILHEFRLGEMANCREVPFIPYYGTIDATPLFIITLEQYVRWTNDLEFLRLYWPNALAAVEWMQRYGDFDGDGFLEYAKVSDKGLVNQGWKDSWDSVSHEDGRLAHPPIALSEVQGYTYAAYRAMSYLATRLGQVDAAASWDRQAEHLRSLFVERFWWPEEDTFYLALDGDKRPCKVVSSNPGHCLWSGIVPEDHANALVDRMMRQDMYTEWGIRTLSSTAARYNPMSYHNGSVWPHDTAMVGAGFSRYGRKHEAGELLGHLFGVSLHYAGSRLPELFCGFERLADYGPTRYPVACSPQSWAAGAPFLLLSSTLGFEPEAERQRLTLRNPSLPAWMRTMELDGLRIGSQELRLRFERSQHGTSVVLTGGSDVEVRVLA
ncbi:MAG: amylo-alpha-1,6-glucosidase [Ktedonobacterales bacterium]